MNTYLIVKTLHILSATLMVGTGFGTAFYLFWANRSGSVPAQAVVSKWVIKADWWFTTPAVIFQPLSGWWMMSQAHLSFDTKWIAWTIGLYVLSGICWLPVVWLQVRMAAMARGAHATQAALPALYAVYARRWEALGYPAFIAMAVTYYLMVNKPMLWGG